MTKTPDEIKKGLECCTMTLCAECPYDNEPSCIVKNADALVLIQQLEAQNAEKDARIQQLEAERDAAVESMRKDPHCCFHCKHKGKWFSCNSDPRPNGSCFEWRGVQKEDGND